jgi:hypothetical protein
MQKAYDHPKKLNKKDLQHKLIPQNPNLHMSNLQPPEIKGKLITKLFITTRQIDLIPQNDFNR